MKNLLMVIALILCIPLLFGAVSVLSNAIGGDKEPVSELGDIPDAPYYTIQYAGFEQNEGGVVTLSYTVDLVQISQIISDGYEVTLGILIGKTPRSEGELKLAGSFSDGYSLASGVGNACVFYCSDPENQEIVDSSVEVDGGGRFTFEYQIPNAGFLDGEGIVHRGFATVSKDGEEKVKYTSPNRFTFYGGTAYLGDVAPDEYFSVAMNTQTEPTPAWNCLLTFEDVTYYTEQGYRVMVGYTSMTLETYSSLYGGKNIFDDPVPEPELNGEYLLWVGAAALQTAYDSERDGALNEISFSRVPYDTDSTTAQSFFYVAVCLVDADGNLEVLSHGPAATVYGKQMVSDGSFYPYQPA